MAKKEKKEKQNKTPKPQKEKVVLEKSKLMEVLTKDYKWENLIMSILAIIAAAVAGLIISGTLEINPSTPIIGPVLGVSPNNLIFAWILMAVAVIGLFLVLYPFFLPALPELKKISWPTRKVFMDHAVRVVIFVVILALLLVYFDFIGGKLIAWIQDLVS